MNEWFLVFGVVFAVLAIPFLISCWVLSQLVLRSVRHITKASLEPPNHILDTLQPAIAALQSLGLNLIGYYQIERVNLKDKTLNWGVLLESADRIFVGVSIPELVVVNAPALSIGISSFFDDGKGLSTTNLKLDRFSAKLFSKPRAEILITQNLEHLAIAELLEAHQAKFSELCETRQPLSLSPNQYIQTLQSFAVKESERLHQGKEIIWVEPNHSYRLPIKTVLKAAWFYYLQNWAGMFGANQTVIQPEIRSLELEIEQFEAQQLIQPTKISPKLQRWLLIGSLAMFVAVYASFFSPKTLVVLVAVLLLHEGGHVLAMKYFGYRDVTMLFIPFLGALATARKEDASLSEKVWISLAGPLPGLILGIGLGIISAHGHSLFASDLFAVGQANLWVNSEVYSWMRSLTLTLIGLNLFNLLPIYPLDGGQVADLLLFTSNPYLGVLFKSFGVGILVLIGLKSPLFLVFAALIALSIPNSFRVAKVHNLILKGIKQNSVNESAGIIRTIFENLHQPPYHKFAFAQKSAIAKVILDSQKERSAGWKTRLGLSFIYLFSLIGGLIGGLYAISPNPQLWAVMAQSLTYIGKDSKVIMQERVKEKIASTTRQIELNPQNATAHLDRGNAYLAIKNTEQALIDANQVIKLDPLSGQGYMLRGRIWRQKNNVRQSEADFKTGRNLSNQKQIQIASEKLKQNPKDTYAYISRANAYADLNDRPKALSDYDKAIALKPDEYQIYISRANFYLVSKEYQLSIADLSQAIKLNPKDGEIYYLRSEAYKQIGEMAKSNTDLQKAKLYGYEE
jgi:tetratricopeptide (TPR) repeat protein/Zn-dependent protease